MQKKDRPMIKLFGGALAVFLVCVGLAACGDTRTNKDLNGVATWPMGGPAHGAWTDSPPPPAAYGTTETTTTVTTTTARPY
jgi:hypothetical protein